MKRVLLFVVLAALSAAGCSRDGQRPSAPDQSAMRPGEMPGAVAAVLDRHAADQGDVASAALRYPEFTGPGALPWTAWDAYAVTFVWGEFPLGPAAVVPPTDWSGSLAIENAAGLLDVVAVIDFEPGQDSVLPSASSPTALWTSFTEGDLDGLSFLVFLDPESDAAANARVRFKTPLCELALTRDQLTRFTAFYIVGHTHVVAVKARRIWHHACPRGFISGEWTLQSNTGDSGYFSGLWYDRTNTPIGVMSAVYRKTPEGDRVYAGSISGVLLDVVIGEVSGIWQYDDPRMCPTCGAGHGWFRGRFVFYEMGGEPRREGCMAGIFGNLSAPTPPALPLRGIWIVDCPDSTSVVSPTAD
ncbi:MAG TPA: hypothetical protein PLR32_04315 [candidate division Zixibacteria bacterium]|nr:hypothetical protein [candidate division Zixibacteria bacterium]MDD4916663.1 hypothetical protein [candidate division Zixibacteria bacterium]MDM7973221.1 hypothetical protein [candidate division Zixibacteria bacterium]HOD66013.1 hypothetical protein [candidate division Zixibacteria bacterium]HPI32518.1 hypothetical protein [candidate division Zixibacteria bacterium]